MSPNDEKKRGLESAGWLQPSQHRASRRAESIPDDDHPAGFCFPHCPFIVVSSRSPSFRHITCSSSPPTFLQLQVRGIPHVNKPKMYDAVYCSARPLDSPGGRETEGENSRDRQARRSYLAEEASEGQYRRSATVHTSRPERDVASAWGGQRGSYRSRESLSRVASEFRSFGGRPTTDQPADSRSYWKNSSHYSSSGLRGHSTPSPRHVNGSTHTSRPEHSSKKPPQPLAVDWADVERRARENGFIVPGDIVEE